jgi:hypothetical protein
MMAEVEDLARDEGGTEAVAMPASGPSVRRDAAVRERGPAGDDAVCRRMGARCGHVAVSSCGTAGRVGSRFETARCPDAQARRALDPCCHRR